MARRKRSDDVTTQEIWFSIACLSFYLAVPTGAWWLLGPEGFWQKIAMVALTIVWLVGGGILTFVFWGVILSAIDEGRK